MQPSIGLIVVVSTPEVGSEHAPAILRQVTDVFKEAELHVVAPAVVRDASSARAAGATFQDVDAICVVAATWSEDFLVQDILSAMRSPVPVIAWGLPGLHAGSLCGTQQLCCVLKELGYTYRFVFGELIDRSALSRVIAFSQAAAAQRILRKTRVGRVGSRMKGMAEVSVDELELRSVLGPRLVEKGLDWLAKEVESANSADADKIWRRVRGIAGLSKVSDVDGILAARYYLALRNLVRTEELSAFTVECYPDLMGCVCLPIALLAAEDVVGACEGDVNSAVAMRLLSWFTGSPVHNTDLLTYDREENTFSFGHCGSGAFCLANCHDDIILDSCRLTDAGVTVHYPGRPGRVTLINLVGRHGTYRFGAAVGEAIRTELVFPGNPVKVRLEVPISEFLDDVADAGLGHHWMIGYGNVLPTLLEFGRLTGIPVHVPGLRPLGHIEPLEDIDQILSIHSLGLARGATQPQHQVEMVGVDSSDDDDTDTAQF
ncbi:MAG: hypothetical protein M1133_09380 [Armatimonadetes bacterium]|nr:hypothetical protein [Armatimonadota bacterium]